MGGHTMPPPQGSAELKPTSSDPQTGCHSPRCHLSASCNITSELTAEPSPPGRTQAQVVKETSHTQNGMHPGLKSDFQRRRKNPFPLAGLKDTVGSYVTTHEKT